VPLHHPRAAPGHEPAGGLLLDRNREHGVGQDERAACAGGWRPKASERKPWPSAVTYFSFIKSKRASSGIIMPIAILTPAKENSHVTNFARGNDDTLDLRRDSRCHKGGLGGVGDGSKLPEIST
jgi:hypothetical protein